jgi:hypothetical protein
MPVLQPSPINIQTDEWKEARPHLMRALNYLIKDIYEWIANIQGLGSDPSTAITDHDHTAANAGGDYPFGDITQSMVTYLAALQTDILVSNVCDKVDNEIISGTWIFGNTSLTLYDTGGDHVLTLKVNENLTGSKTLNIITGDADRTITLSGNPTLADWFDQAVKAASSPTFATVKLSGLSDGYVPYHVADATGLADSIMTVTSGGLTIGTGVAGTDYTLTFNGETNDGVLTWMEDEDYFQFSDVVKTSGRIEAVSTKTTTYVLTAADENIICNSTTAFTVTLPSATGSGRRYKIKNINTGTITIDGDSSDTIDGSTTVNLIQWEAVQLVDYVANKWIIE